MKQIYLLEVVSFLNSDLVSLKKETAVTSLGSKRMSSSRLRQLADLGSRPHMVSHDRTTRP